jgi:hypothetical protein
MGKDKMKDFLDTSRQERNDYFKDTNIFARTINSVQDKEQDLLEWATSFDTVKGSKARGITRIANTGDFAAILDSSADRYTHGNPFVHLMGGGPHDYHDGIAQYKAGFDNTITDRPGGFNAGYRMPFNPTPMTQTKTPGSTISASYISNMTAILEAVGAGTAVALLNKSIINNNWLWNICLGCNAQPMQESADPWAWRVRTM